MELEFLPASLAQHAYEEPRYLQVLVENLPSQPSYAESERLADPEDLD
jgi:hypothetical protein